MYIKERFTELTNNELKKTQKKLDERFAELGGKNDGYFYDNYDKETIPTIFTSCRELGEGSKNND